MISKTINRTICELEINVSKTDYAWYIYFIRLFKFIKSLCPWKMLLCYIKQEKTIKRYNKSGKKYPFFHKITTISVNIFMKYFLVFFFLCLTSPSYILGIMIVKKEEFERVFFFIYISIYQPKFFCYNFCCKKTIFSIFFCRR